MIIYIEDTIIENFLITYLILNIIFSFIKEEKYKIRVIFACIFASIMSVAYPLIKISGILMLILKLLIGYIIVLIAYKTNNLKKQIFFWIMFLFVTAIYGGINLMIYYSLYGDFESSQKMPTVLILTCLFTVSYFLNQCQINLYQKKQINNFIYDIVITNQDCVIKTKAYLDSGNILTDNLTQKPIVLVNFKMFSKINKNYPVEYLLTKCVKGLKNGHYLSVKTATSVDNLLVFEIDCLEIIHKEKTQKFINPMFALSKVKITGFNCDVVLNSKLIGD